MLSLNSYLKLATVSGLTVLSFSFSNYSVQASPNNSMLLSESQINSKIQDLPQWTRNDKIITRTFMFNNFVEAIAFVNQLVEPSETAGHHPDLEISYNKVTVHLSTHDAGGLTELDFSLAKVISDLANN